MRYEIPEDPQELKRKWRDLNDELNITKSELARQKDDNKFLRAALEYLPNSIFIKDEGGNFITFSNEYEHNFGVDKRKYIGKCALDLDYLPPDDRIKYHEEDLSLINSTNILHYEQNFLFSDNKEHPCFYWSKGFKVPETGERGLIGEIVDITKEKELLNALEEAKNEVEEASKIDPGTGLYNRYVFSAQTIDLINNARADGTPLSVMMADLDHFKRVNDTFGHLEGDNVLKNFASLIKQCIRSEDVAIRYGGEEFLIFLPGTDLPRAKIVAERLRASAEEKMVLPDNSHLTVSIGLVKFNPKETRTQCIQRADEALYTAKETGRNQVVVFADESETYMG